MYINKQMAIAVDMLNKQVKSYEHQVDFLLIFSLNLSHYMCNKSDQIHFLAICQAM